MTEVETDNFYAGIPEQLPEEITEVLVRGENVRIERIISQGQTSPPGCWYDQRENEWVLLFEGEAELRFAARDRSVRLNAGDYLHIPAHERHRVEWTKPDGRTIWLAVFYGVNGA